MPTLNTSFKNFLSNIEPSGEVKQYAQDAHKPVRDYLKDDETFGEFFVDSFLYGSYARHTAVGNIKDVDIVAVTNFDPESSEHTPQKVLRKLKKALTTYYNEPSSTSYNRKSVQVNDPLPNNPDVEMTLDVIPAIPIDEVDNLLLVPDRQDGEWVYSHPKGHLKYTSALNDEKHGNGMYVPLVKIMKHWWIYNAPKKKAQPKGFWIETLTGKYFDQSQSTYAEHFVAVLENIIQKYSYYKSMAGPPKLADPAMPGDTIKTSMTLEEFQVFMDVANDSLVLAKRAINNTDKYEGSRIWNNLFGDGFPITERVEITKSLSQTFTDEYFSTQEQFLFRDFDIKYEDRGYDFRINCHVEKKGYRKFRLRSMREPVLKHCRLEYFIERSSVPEPYTVMWKVKNTGEEAKAIGQLRGEITLDSGQRKKWENSLYTGTHYVECYAINKDNICVAKDRIYITIR